jgi:hypothetical protein
MGNRFSSQYCFVIFGVAVMRLPSLPITTKKLLATLTEPELTPTNLPRALAVFVNGLRLRPADFAIGVQLAAVLNGWSHLAHAHPSGESGLFRRSYDRKQIGRWRASSLN